MAKTPKAAPTAAPKKQPRISASLPTRPRVDLLPPIVEIRRQENKKIRQLSLGLVGLGVVVVLGSIGMTTAAAIAENSLATENAKKAHLLAEQKNYSEVIAVKSLLGDYDAAVSAALFSEADWARIMRELDTTMPEGVAIASEIVNVKGLDASVVPTLPVQIDVPGVITVSFTALSANVISATEVLNRLGGMTGYASAHVESVAGSAENGYTVTGIVELNAAALGGTPRTGMIVPEQLAAYHEALHLTATQPPAPKAPSEDEAEDTATATGE